MEWGNSPIGIRPGVPIDLAPFFWVLVMVLLALAYIQIKAMRWNLPFHMAAWMLWRDLLVALRIRKI